MQNENTLVEALCQSKVYQDYERAFSDATGLPVALRPVEVLVISPSERLDTLAARHVCASLGIKPEEERHRFGFAA